MGQDLQSPDLSLEELYEQGRHARPELEEFGHNFLRSLQQKYPVILDSVQFELAPLKRMERVVQKVEGDYDGDHTRVADIVRGRLLAHTPEQIAIIRREMDGSRSELGIEKYKDFYAEPVPSHFRSLNTQIRMPNGHVTEFRVDQYDMAAAGDAGHRLYEEQQEIDRIKGRPLTPEETARRQELLERQRTLYDPVAQRVGLDVLLNDRGRASLHGANRSANAATPPQGIARFIDRVSGAVPLESIASRFNRLSGAVPSERIAAYFNRAAGVAPHAALGLSAYSVGTRAFGFDEGYNQDMAAGGARATFAGSALALDMTAAGADAASLAARGMGPRIGGVSTFLNANAGRYALSGLERAAVPLAIGAGVFETAAAVKAHDPERAAGASGCTFGGIGGGALLGAAAGIETGPGAIVTGIIGGVLGCVGGKYVATRYASGLAADLMGTPIDPVAARYGGLADPDHYTGAAMADSQASTDSLMGRVLDRDGDGQYSLDEHSQLYRALGLETKDGQIVMKDVNADGALTATDAVAAIRSAFIAKDRTIWSVQNGLTGLSGDALRDRLIEEGTIPDPATWQGRSVAARDALRNPAFVQQNIEALEIIHARGDADFSEPIAALRQLREIEPPAARSAANAPALQVQPSF